MFGNNNEIYPDPVNKATREYKVFWAVELPSGQNVRGVRSIREGEKVKFNGSVDGAKLVWWNNDIEKPIKNNTIIFGRFIENDKTETKQEELHSKLSLLIDFTRDIVKESKKFLKSSDEEKEKILENVEEVVKRASNNHGKSESAMQSSINECEEILKRFTEEGPKQNDTSNVNITENKSKPDFIGNIIKGNDNLVIGQGNAVFGTNVHLGEKNKSSVNNNIILGSNITNTDVNNAIVIGNGSKAIENAVSIGNDKTTRQIKYVKAGTDDTDAVNVKQLKDYVAANSKGLGDINAKSNIAIAGVANAIAMSSMTQPRTGLVNITGAYGTYGGEHALAVGISGNTERLSYKLGVSTNMKGNVGVGLGFGVTVVSSTKDDVIKTMEKKILEYMKESKEQNERIKELENEMKELRKLIKRN